jgi:hypothetical protein
MSERKHDYIPQNAAQFMVFGERLIHIVEERALGPNADWTNIPQTRVEELAAKFKAFAELFNTFEAVQTKGNRERRHEAQAEATRELRGFVNQFLRFPPVTNGDRTDMGVPNHDTVRTDHTVVTEMVAFVIRLGVIRELVIDFWIEGADHKAKPAGYDGAVIIWGILDGQPQRHEDLDHHTMASRTPFTLHFEEEDRGKTVWIALAWQNERGITGAWSAYKTAVVP